MVAEHYCLGDNDKGIQYTYSSTCILASCLVESLDSINMDIDRDGQLLHLWPCITVSFHLSLNEKLEAHPYIFLASACYHIHFISTAGGRYYSTVTYHVIRNIREVTDS